MNTCNHWRVSSDLNDITRFSIVFCSQADLIAGAADDDCGISVLGSFKL
jgi:hypothetical protein